MKNVQIFQTLQEGSALAKEYSGLGVFAGDVVELITTEEMYYDNLKVRGTFVLLGTYSYLSMDDLRKTVPVYLRWSEYRKLVAEGVKPIELVNKINYGY